MKKISFLTYALILPLAFVGCSSELPNMECDIEQCWMHVDRPDTLLQSDTTQKMDDGREQTDIVFRLQSKKEFEGYVRLYFKITDKATIYQASTNQPFRNGDSVYFKATEQLSSEEKFVVRSEDGNYSRTYSVSLKYTKQTAFPADGNYYALLFDEGSYTLDPKNNSKFYIWQEMNPCLADKNSNIHLTWANGNGGFKMSMGTATPFEYPSIPGINAGVDGNSCLILTTRSTGKMGASAKKPIAAGSFFVGSFDMGKALTKPLEATKFGVPFDHKPTHLRGYYKYVPGAQMTDKNMATIAGDDTLAIYAVLFDNNNQKRQLNGGNVNSDPSIVAMARLQNKNMQFYPKGTDITKAQWIAFNLPFDYNSPTIVSMDDIYSSKYSLTIVFSSSRGGDTFEGAIGSTLYIDNVTIDCEY